MDEIIDEIIEKRPNDTWLKGKLVELDAEINEIKEDRNRLVEELSRSRSAANHLRLEIHELKQGRS